MALSAAAEWEPASSLCLIVIVISHFRYWHFSDVAARAGDVRSLGLKQTLAVASIKRVSQHKPGVGVVKSLELIGSGPVGVVHTQNFQFF
jgi:hypothetical protein